MTDYEEYKFKLEKEHEEYVDNFCVLEYLDSNTTKVDITGTFQKIAEELWNIKRELIKKENKNFILGDLGRF